MKVDRRDFHRVRGMEANRIWTSVRPSEVILSGPHKSRVVLRNITLIASVREARPKCPRTVDAVRSCDASD